MIHEAPQPQIWTESQNLKNHYFYHFCDLEVRFWSLAELVFQASPEALLLHAFIKMLEVPGKNAKGPDGRPKI